MRSLIVYSSKSGNTRKLAEAIHAFLPGEKMLKSVEENPDVNGFDFICVGFWFQAGKSDAKSADFLRALKGSQPLFLFATHGAAVDSDHARNGMKLARDIVSSETLIDTFSCQGEVSADFLAKAKNMNPVPPWIDGAAGAVGHPDSNDIKRLEETLEKALLRYRALYE